MYQEIYEDATYPFALQSALLVSDRALNHLYLYTVSIGFFGVLTYLKQAPDCLRSQSVVSTANQIAVQPCAAGTADL